MNYEVQVSISLTKAGIPGDNIGKIICHSSRKDCLCLSEATVPSRDTVPLGTEVASSIYSIENLRIIGTEDSTTLPKVDLLSEWSIFSNLETPQMPEVMIQNRSMAMILEAEEDLDESARAPVFELGYEAQLTQKLLKALQPNAGGTLKKLGRDLRENSTVNRRNYIQTFDVISQFDHFIRWRDRSGNSVAHHLAYAGLRSALQAVFAAQKSLRWAENESLETPMMITDGFSASGQRVSQAKRVLHHAISKGNLFKMGSSGFNSNCVLQHSLKLKQMAMRCPDDFSTPLGDVSEIVRCLQTRGQAAKGLDLASKSSDVHASIYNAAAMLDLNMGIKQVSIQVNKYLQKLLASTDKNEYIDPMLYYVYYLTWKKYGNNRKSECVRAAFALTALRCFPVFAESWVDAEDDIDTKVKSEGLMEQEESDMDDDDDELDDNHIMLKNSESPEAEWQLAKADHKLAAEAMDQLMALTGLREIKMKAMGVVKEVLLQKGRPASVKAETSMNFLFTGNPGCGKTTVAKLLARAMNQLGFRKNATMIETSAQDILKKKDPGSDFAEMMKNATGGCLFIDEAYRFSPSPAGQQPNASNEVLDFLLESVEKPEIRSRTTVILAGYRDEIETLLAYNVGFASRFNREFSFPDYTEAQLCKIFLGMVKDKGFLLERKKDCGVSISAVMANRIHRGAGKKGFGNAREVRNKVEEVIAQQSDRLGTMRLHKKPVSERDYKLLLAVDSVGVRPDFSRSPIMRELETMVGLNKVKEQFRNLMMMATQNFDREMRGEKPNLISLHRVFYGNPGTGKTTVARLYGALLKELGYLSKGDFISVTPADLTGDAEGGAATNTKAVLDKAKGKVLLIDEAYILDPKRKNNIYGGNVLDTMVEKLDGDAGSDCAVILAGYRQEMFDMLENNPGLRRRFNIDDFGIEFEVIAA
jgi:SpoVK/Ycf46/Vps4 family AAA+-type ATPase